MFSLLIQFDIYIVKKLNIMGYVLSISNLGMSITIMLIVKVIVKELWD